jgi:DNA-binding GntR family transcriptional regulator
MVRDKILRGEFPLGSALSRRRLAKELRMSFLPISEGLQRLELDGLVESKPRVGTRVRMPTAADVRERYVLREALETQAARLFAEHASEEQRAELSSIARQLDTLYASGADADEDLLYSVHTHHMRFHMRLAEVSGALLSRAIEREQVLVFNWLFDTTAQRRTLPRDFHGKLAAALVSGDVHRADAAMRDHIRYGLEQVLEAIPEETPNGSWRVRGARAQRRSAADKNDLS